MAIYKGNASLKKSIPIPSRSVRRIQPKLSKAGNLLPRRGTAKKKSAEKYVEVQLVGEKSTSHRTFTIGKKSITKVTRIFMGKRAQLSLRNFIGGVFKLPVNPPALVVDYSGNAAPYCILPVRVVEVVKFIGPLPVNPGVGFGLVRDDSKLPSQTKEKKMNKRRRAQRAARKVARQQSKARLIAKRVRRIVATARRNRLAAQQLVIRTAAKAVVDTMPVSKTTKLVVILQGFNSKVPSSACPIWKGRHQTPKATLKVRKVWAAPKLKVPKQWVSVPKPELDIELHAKLDAMNYSEWRDYSESKLRSRRRRNTKVELPVITSTYVYPDIVAADSMDAASLAAMQQGANFMEDILSLKDNVIDFIETVHKEILEECIANGYELSGDDMANTMYEKSKRMTGNQFIIVNYYLCSLAFIELGELKLLLDAKTTDNYFNKTTSDPDCWAPYGREFDIHTTYEGVFRDKPKIVINSNPSKDVIPEVMELLISKFGKRKTVTPAPLVSTTAEPKAVVEDSKNKGKEWHPSTQVTINKEISSNMRTPLAKINDGRLNLITELANTSGMTKDLPVDKLVAICVGMSKEDEYGNTVSANVNGTLPLNVEHELSERWFNMAFGELHSEGVNRVFGGFDTVVNKDAAPIAFTTAQVREVYEYIKKGRPTLGAKFRSAYMSSVYKYPMPAQIILDTQNFGAKGTTPSANVAMVRGTIRDLILAGESGNVGDISIVAHKPLAESLSDSNNRMPDGKGGFSRRKLYLVVANATEHVVNEKGYARQERYYCDEIHIYEILDADYESMMTAQGKFNDEFLVACGLLDAATPIVKAEPVAPKVEVVVEQPVVPRKPPVVEAKVDDVVVPRPPMSPVKLSERYKEFIAINRARDPVANLKRNDAAIDAGVLFTDANLRSSKGTFTDSVVYNLLVAKYGKAAVAGNVSGQNIALACRYYIESHVSPAEADSKGNIDFSNYRWTITDVLHIFHIINLMSGVFRLKGHAIEIKEITGGVSIEFTNNEIRFTLMNDLAYSTRGQCFLPTIEHVTNDKDDVSEVKLVSSIGNFVKLLYLGYVPLVAQWQSNKASNTCTNLEEFINAASQMVNLSTDEVMSQGAALHTILNTYKPVIHCEVNPCANHKWVNLGMSPARQLSRKYLAAYGKQVSVSNKVLKSGIKHALDTYGMTTDINKSSYVRGSLGHIDLAVIAKTAPSIYADIVAYIGANAANIANLINIGTKIEKGIKRIRLSLAQAASVRNAVLMGWKLTGMRGPGYGALLNTCYLLNHVIAPGQSYFIGDEKDMPTAVVPTTTKGYALYEWDAENILDFESTILEYEPKELTTVNNWHTYTFTGNPVVITGSGKELLATVKNAVGVKLPIVHESHKTGHLISIAYRIVDDIVKGAKKLIVRWTIEREEHFGKIRSIVKAQLVLAGKEVLYNSFNTNIPAGIQAVHFQDGIKSDVLYSWLMVAGNTVAHNQGNPKIAKLESLVRKANIEVMGRDQADYLHLDAHALVSATYKEVLAEFEAVFGRIVWSYHPFVGDQGKAMWEIYKNHPKWSDDTSCLNDHEVEQLLNLKRVTVRTNGKDDKASVLIFVRNEEGVITELYQRGFGFVGIEGCPLLNVELFESSTVNQSVSGSRQMASFIRALGVVAKDSDAVYQEQLDMLDETENVLLEAKMMNAFAAANDFDLVVDGVVTKKRIINLEYFSASGLDDGGSQFGKVNIADAEYLNGLLADVDLTNLNDSSLFKQVASALRNVVFKLQGSSLTSMWLPGLYAFSHLTGNAISTESVTGMVFYTVVLPLLRGAALPSIAINRVRGKIDAYISGAEFIKLLKGRKSAGAKRVANNHLAAGQTMILFSSVADSAFQQFLRDGIYAYDALAGELVLVNGNRCPIAAGTVSRLYVAIQHEDGTQTCNGINNGKPLFYKSGPDQIAISCMMVYIDGGDFDGDGHYCTALKNVAESEIHTFEDIARLCAASLGVDNMFDVTKVEKQYATDHYGIKDYYKCMENLSHGIVKSIQKASKVKDDRKLLADPANDETYLETLQKSYEMFAVSTGKAYDVYMLGEHIINIVQGYAKAGLEVPESMQCLTKPSALSLVLVISQLYEIILGGYNKSTWPMWAEYLYHTISEANRVIKGEDIVKFNAACKGMGINVVDIEDLASIYNLVRLCVCMEKADVNREGVKNVHLEAVDALSTDEQFILSSALVAFELSRGKFEGFSGSFRPMKYSAMARGHRRALMNVVKYLNDNSSIEVYNKAFNNSLVILSIFKILDIIGEELTEVSKTVVRNHEYNIDEEVAGGLIKATFKSAHLDYFTSKLGDDVVEEDDEDLPEEDNGGGGSTPPVQPEGNNGGGNAVELVTPRAPHQSAPAEQVVEAKKFVSRGTPVPEAPVVFQAEEVVEAKKFVGRPQVVVEEPVVQATKFVPRALPAVLEEDYNDYDTTIVASRFIARNVGGESPLPYIEEIKEDDIEMTNTIVRAPDLEGVRVEQSLYPESLFDGLNVKQRDTFLQVLYGKNVYLEGEGGTGKTYTSQRITDYMRANGWDVFKTGSTGTSVMNIDGDGTLNSVMALGTGFNTDIPRSTADQANDLYAASKNSDAVKKLFRNKNKKLFFSIDEVFMVDSRLFWITVKVLTELAAEKGFKLQWLISGDPLQLGVVKGIETFKDALLVDGYAKNHSKGIVIDTFKKCILTKIERQDNVDFITDLSLVRQGCAAGPVIQERLEASKPRIFPEDAIHTYATNPEVSKHNDTVLDRLIKEGNDDFTFKAEVQNYHTDRSWVKKLQPIEEYMKVVKGMSVMFRMNLKASNDAIEIVSTPKGYEYTSDKLITANGTVGKVTAINIGFKPYTVTVELSTGVVIKVKQTALNVESKRDGTPKGKFVQLPFHASHALTYWKLQGLTLDVPLVVHQYWLDYKGRIKELSADRHCGAMYVACSRVTRPELLWFGIGGETGYQLLTASTHVNKEAQVWLSQQ